jgi:hypothetical protein
VAREVKDPPDVEEYGFGLLVGDSWHGLRIYRP